MSVAPTLKDLFSALQRHMITDAEFSGALSHPTDKGDNSEANWIEWFAKYLPKRYKAAKATIIDSQGDISDQIDLVLYDAQYSYLAFNQNEILYLPAESVYAVFEIKQDLTKEHMEYAGKKIASVRRLYRTSASHRQKSAWPMARGSAVIVTLRVEGADGSYVAYESNGQPLSKHCSLHFKALTGVKAPYTVKWQITNTGDEATRAGCLRGDFYDSNEGVNGREESTLYTGTHAVQCFVIKRGICVARSKDFVINVF